MKQWTTPDIEELNINETESGSFPTEIEGTWMENLDILRFFS